MYCIFFYNIIYLYILVKNMNNYREFCNFFYAAHYLPLALYDQSRFLFAAGFSGAEDPYPLIRRAFTVQDTPAVYTSSDTGYYGYVPCDDRQHYLILGPTYSTPVTEEMIHTYMRKNILPSERQESIAQFLGRIPTYTYNQFLNMLLYLFFTLTGEEKEITDVFGVTDTQYQTQIGRDYAQRAYREQEAQWQHGTYGFERQMLAVIQSGDVARLHQFLINTLNTTPMQEGKLADTPLRQAKNLLIGTVGMVGKEAAIPGGMDIEQTYRLIDTYIQECERLQTVEAVKNLQYNMLIDFTQRISQQHAPAHLSEDVFAATQYISTHLNEPIGVDDVVAHNGKSRAYLCKKFHDELDMGIAAYILRCRLREAKLLLRYTEKPLGEISNFLCFSSQSHFQNVFKKHCEMTPMEYRNGKG